MKGKEGVGDLNGCVPAIDHDVALAVIQHISAHR